MIFFKDLLFDYNLYNSSIYIIVNLNVELNYCNDEFKVFKALTQTQINLLQNTTKFDTISSKY